MHFDVSHIQLHPFIYDLFRNQQHGRVILLHKNELITFHHRIIDRSMSPLITNSFQFRSISICFENIKKHQMRLKVFTLYFIARITHVFMFSHCLRGICFWYTQLIQLQDKLFCIRYGRVQIAIQSDIPTTTISRYYLNIISKA